jgi:hypothetical protein
MHIAKKRRKIIEKVKPHYSDKLLVATSLAPPRQHQKSNISKSDASNKKIVHKLDCYRWYGGDEVNDRPVGKPQEEGMMNTAASFSLSKKPRFYRSSRKKSNTPGGDAC